MGCVRLMWRLWGNSASTELMNITVASWKAVPTGVRGAGDRREAVSGGRGGAMDDLRAQQQARRETGAEVDRVKDSSALSGWFGFFPFGGAWSVAVQERALRP